jgi:hypothetical protein
LLLNNHQVANVAEFDGDEVRCLLPQTAEIKRQN